MKLRAGGTANRRISKGGFALLIPFSQLPSAKAKGLGFKGSRGQVKRHSKPFLESLAPGPLESLRQHRPLN